MSLIENKSLIRAEQEQFVRAVSVVSTQINTKAQLGAVVQSFDPDAVDGDGDGIVQDGSPFERPAVISAISKASQRLGQILGKARQTKQGKVKEFNRRYNGMSAKDIAADVVPDSIESWIAKQYELLRLDQPDWSILPSLTGDLSPQEIDDMARALEDFVEPDLVWMLSQENADKYKELKKTDRNAAFRFLIEGAFNFSPKEVAKNRRLVEHVLTTNPQFRELVNRFGMPTLTMYGPNMSDSHMAAGFFSERIGISVNWYRNPTSKGILNSAGSKLGNWFMTGIMTPDVGSKKTKRWLTRSSPEGLLVHEYGHHLSDMLGRTMTDAEKRDMTSGKAASWRFSIGSDWKETFKAVGWPEAYDEYSLPLADDTDIDARSRKKSDRRDVPSNIPHVLTGYGESSPSEAWAESIAALIAHDGVDKDLVSEGMTWLVRDALDLPDNDIRGSLTTKRATREIVPDGFASRGATVEINNEKDPRFGDLNDPYELTAEVLGTLDGDDPVGEMVRRLQEIKDDPAQYDLLRRAGNESSVDVPLNIRVANEAEAALLAEVLINDPAFADMIRRHGIPNFYFSQTDLKLREDFDVRGMLSGGYVADDSPNGKFYPPRIVIDLIGAPHERGTLDTPFEPDSRADVQEYSKGRAPGNITRKFVSRSDKHVIRHEGGHGVLDQLWERQYEGKIKGRRAQLIRAYSKPTWEEFYKELGRPDLWAEHQRALRATYPSQQGTLERAFRRVIPGNPNISDEVQQVDSAYAWSNPKEMFAEGFSAYTASNPAFRGLLNDTMIDHLQSILGDADTDIPEPPSMPESRDLGTDIPEPPAWDGFASTGAPIESYASLRRNWVGMISGNDEFTRKEFFENTTTEQKLDLAVPRNERDWALMAWDQQFEAMGFTWDQINEIDIHDPFNPEIPDDLVEGKEYLEYFARTLLRDYPDFSPDVVQANRDGLRAALDAFPRFREVSGRLGIPPIVTMTSANLERYDIQSALAEAREKFRSGKTISQELQDIMPAFNEFRDTGNWQRFMDDPAVKKLFETWTPPNDIVGGYDRFTNSINLTKDTVDKFMNGTRVDHKFSPSEGDFIIGGNDLESVLLHEFGHYLDHIGERTDFNVDSNGQISVSGTLSESQSTAKKLFENVGEHIKTRYGQTNQEEFVAEIVAAVLSGSRDQEALLSPEARQFARKIAGLPEKDSVFAGRTNIPDTSTVTLVDRFGSLWNRTPEGEWINSNGMTRQGRAGVPDVLETMADAKRRTGLKQFDPVEFDHDGRKFTIRQANDTFSIEINGRTVATANVVEGTDGLPEINNVDVLPGYTGVAPDKDLHEMVVDHARKKYPSSRAPERAREAAIQQDGFASVGPEHHDARQIDGTAGTPEYAQAVAGEFEAAQATGKKVFFDYNGETREVEVTEVFEKKGVLYMRGNDALRNGEERMFRLDRVSMPKRVENPDTGAAEVVKKPGKPPRKPVPVFTGKAAELFEGAASWEEVAARLGKGRYVFFDFETTGIEEDEFGGMKHPGTPTQIGLTEIVDGKITRQWSTHVNPGRPLSIDPKTGRSWSADNLKYKDPDTGELVNISDEWLATQRPLSEALDEMLEFIGPIEDTILGGQNHPYDDDVMKRAMADSGLDPARWNPGGFIDSQALAQALLDKNSDDYPKNEKGTKTVSLGYLATFLGHDMGEGWHSADADAEASYESFKRLIDRAALHENSGKPVRRDLFAPGGALKEHKERLDDYDRQQRGYDYKVKKYKEQAAAAAMESPATEGFASRGAKKLRDLVKERRRAKDPTAWKNLTEKEKQAATKASADRAIFMLNELLALGYDAESLQGLNRADLDAVFLDMFPDGSVRVSDFVTGDGKPLVQVNSATMGKVFMSLGFHVEVVSSDPNEKYILENGINDMQKALQDYVAAAALDPKRLQFDAVFKAWAANFKDPKTGKPAPIDVSMLGKEGSMSYADAAKLFAETFEINLCLYYTSGVNMLCGSNIGIERVEMPQVSGRSSGDDTYATRSIKAGLAAAKEIAIDKKKLAELKARDPELYARVIELLDKEGLAKLDKEGKPDPKFEIKKAADLEAVRKLAQEKDPLAKALFDVMNWNNTEADAVPIMDRAAKALGINVGETEFKDPATLLGAQNELQGSKVEGMADGAVAAVLEALPILEARLGRKPTQEELMDYLANEIKHGLFQPVLTAGNEGMQRYLVDGHHRWAGLIVANKKLKEMGLDVQVLLNTKNYETDIRSALELGKIVQTFIGIKDAKLAGEDMFVFNPDAPDLTPEEFDAAIEAFVDAAELAKKIDEVKEAKKYRKKSQYGTELDIDADPKPGLIPKRKTSLSEAVQMATGQNATLEPQSRVAGVKPQSTGYRALDSGMKWNSVEDHVQIETDRGNPLFDTYKEYVDKGYEVAWVTHSPKEAGRYAISADQVNAFDRDEITVDPANIGEVDLAGAILVGKDDEGGFLYARRKQSKAVKQRIETLKAEEGYLDGFTFGPSGTLSSMDGMNAGERLWETMRREGSMAPTVGNATRKIQDEIQKAKKLGRLPTDEDELKDYAERVFLRARGRRGANQIDYTESVEKALIDYIRDVIGVDTGEADAPDSDGFASIGMRPGDRYPFDVRPSAFDKETLDNIVIDATANEADKILNEGSSFTLDERDIKKVEAAIKRLEGLGERGKKRAAKLRRDLAGKKNNDERLRAQMDKINVEPVRPYLDKPGDDDGFPGEVPLDLVAGGNIESKQRGGAAQRDQEVISDDWNTRQQNRIAGVRVPDMSLDEYGSMLPGAPIYRETIKIGRKKYTFEVDVNGIVSVYTGLKYKQVAQLNLDRGHSMQGGRRSENPGRHYIDYVTVDKKHRRKGIATQMAEIAEHAYGGKVEHSTALTALGKKWRDADVKERGATALPLPKDFDVQTPPDWDSDGFASRGNYQPLPTPGDDDGFSPDSTLEKIADQMGLDELPDGTDRQMSLITGRMLSDEATLAEKLGITPEQLREQLKELSQNINDFVERFVNDKTVRKQVKYGYKAISLAAMLLGMKGMKDYMSLLNPNFSGGGDGSGKSNSLLDIIDDMLGASIHEALIAYGSNFANLIGTEFAAMRLATQEKMKQMITDIQARIEGTGQKIGVMSREMWNRLRGAWKLTRAKAPIAVPASAKQWIVAGSTPAWAEMSWIDYQSKSRVTSSMQPTNKRAWADIVSKVGQSPELIDIATYRAGFGYGEKRIKPRDVVRVYLTS